MMVGCRFAVMVESSAASERHYHPHMSHSIELDDLRVSARSSEVHRITQEIVLMSRGLWALPSRLPPASSAVPLGIGDDWGSSSRDASTSWLAGSITLFAFEYADVLRMTVVDYLHQL